jgi:hypothetical protein
MKIDSLSPSPHWGGPTFREGWGEGGDLESDTDPSPSKKTYSLINTDFNSV